jgi:hypothetical protein
MYSPNKAVVAAGFALGSVDSVLQECSLPSVADRGRPSSFVRKNCPSVAGMLVAVCRRPSSLLHKNCKKIRFHVLIIEALTKNNVFIPYNIITTQMFFHNPHTNTLRNQYCFNFSTQKTFKP